MTRSISPVGTNAAAAADHRAAQSPDYRRSRGAKEGYREIAWLLVRYRMDHGLSQQELAQRVGTSYSQISRIENGRQRTSLETLLRIAHALDLKMVVGFEETTGAAAGHRELVAI